VAVLDVRLPDGNGVELCRELRSALPDLRCLMLTSFDDDEALFGAIMAGASGFVLKQVRGNDLVSAVRTVGSGGSLLDARSTAAVMRRIQDEQQQAAPLRALTEQERAVLELIAEGLTNRQIGERLFLAEKTVKNYVSHLLSKLGLEHRTQAAILATKLNAEHHR
jgi:DNA-binding NarL/FixJ family response regulator